MLEMGRHPRQITRLHTQTNLDYRKGTKPENLFFFFPGESFRRVIVLQ